MTLAIVFVTGDPIIIINSAREYCGLYKSE
jgi:hypothetical protein